MTSAAEFGVVHPESYEEYCEAIRSGRAVPSVYHSLVESAIRDGVAPDRIMTSWCLRDSLWGAVRLVGMAMLLTQYRWIGVAVMILSLWAGLRHQLPLYSRLGYCAVINDLIGKWAAERGYLSLRGVPAGMQEQCKARNEEHLRQAKVDAFSPVSRAKNLWNFGSSMGLQLVAAVLGVLLLRSAWVTPSWITICINGALGLFCIVQSAVRMPTMLGFRMRRG